jgi:hypothetical protein
MFRASSKWGIRSIFIFLIRRIWSSEFFKCIHDSLEIRAILLKLGKNDVTIFRDVVNHPV